MKKKGLNESSSSIESTVELEDPYSLFIFAMNAAQTKEKHITRLDRFFRFINVHGNCVHTSLNEQMAYQKTAAFCPCYGTQLRLTPSNKEGKERYRQQ